MKSGSLNLLLVLYLALAVVAPVLFVVIVSFWNSVDYSIIADFTFSNYSRIIFEPAYGCIFLETVFVSLVASMVLLFFGSASGYLIAKMPNKWHLPLLLALTAPFFVGELIRIGALMAVFSSEGMARAPVIGLLADSHGATVLGLFQNWITVPIILVYLGAVNGLSRLSSVARTLGASDISVLTRIVLPVMFRPLLLSFLVVFLGAMTSYAPSKFLGGAGGTLYLQRAHDQMINTGDIAFGSAMFVILILLYAAVATFVWFVLWRRKLV